MALKKYLKKLFIGDTNETASVSVDADATPTDFVVHDEVANEDRFRIQFDGQQVPRILSGTKSNQPDTAKDGSVYVATDEAVIEQYDSDTSSWGEIGASAAALKKGGASELDASDLSGSDGQADYVLQTDGNSVTWADASGASLNRVRANAYVFPGGHGGIR